MQLEYFIFDLFEFLQNSAFCKVKVYSGGEDRSEYRKHWDTAKDRWEMQ